MSRRALVAAPLLTLLLGVSACGSGTDTGTSGAASGGASAAPVKDVVLVTHDSFSLPKPLIQQWETATGYHLVVRSNGDAGQLTNKLVLTQGNPTGDVAFGVDNTFAGRALDNGVFTTYGGTLPAGADRFNLATGADKLVPVDNGDVCVNVDTAWYAAHHQTPPKTLDDLTNPAYKDQFVTEGAPTSSPGFAFLLATIAAKGDGWKAYWGALMANGTKIDAGWDDAYFVDFTGGGGKAASRPIVLSYDSSPAYTVDKKTGRTTTATLLDTCTRQVEYAGILAGAKNQPGAKAFIDFLLSPAVQRALPTSTLDVDPAQVEADRDQWLNDWTDITTK